MNFFLLLSIVESCCEQSYDLSCLRIEIQYARFMISAKISHLGASRQEILTLPRYPI